MTKAEQKELIQDFLKNVKIRMFQKIEKKEFPETWNGIELRQYVIDTVTEQLTWNGTGSDLKKRMKEYRNHKLVHNL